MNTSILPKAKPLSSEIYPHSSCFFHTQLPPTDAMHHLLKSITYVSEESDPQGVAADIIHGLIKLTLQVLKKDSSRSLSQSEITFHRIQQYLQDNYHAYINRKYLSHVFKLHPGYISRLYAEYSKKTFFETLNSMRMEHASILLKNTNQKIYNIASNCGYESIPSFTTAFKKYFGCCPNAYRNIRKEKNCRHENLL